jgi:hypothetical protein
MAAVSIAVAAIAANLPPCGAVTHACIVGFSSGFAGKRRETGMSDGVR